MSTSNSPKFDEAQTSGLATLERREWLRITLSCIADAVITADSKGLVTYLNEAARSLTGWAQSEAIGLSLDQVVQIIKEDTRERIEHGLAGLLGAPAIAGLTNHRLLIALDGSERPISENSATIRDESGEITGFVVVFRDITLIRKEEQAAEEALAYDSAILATLREPYLILDNSLRIHSANESYYREFETNEEETVGRFLYEVGNRQWDFPGLHDRLTVPVPEALRVQEFMVVYMFPNIGRRELLLNATRFPSTGAFSGLILLSMLDVTNRNGISAALRSSELRYRRLFQTAKDGILILDVESGKIIDANPFMCSLLGYEPKDFLGKELWEIGLFEDKEANRAAYRELQLKEYIRYEHLPLKTKRGEEVDVEFVSNIYKVGERQVAQCNIRDITVRSRMEREAKAQSLALADMHRHKDEFLAMLSHELRNPLSPILNAVHLLKLQGNENVIQKEARVIIERQVGQLTHLVDDLLEVARFSTGKIKLQAVRLDMRSVVERAIESARPALERRRHVLSAELPDQPVWLMADPFRMEQVVVNLLNNAAKYTDEAGRIFLTLRTENDAMVLRVRDTGIGLDLEHFPDIFDLFTQASRSLDRSEGGLGIGLALVQRIVDLHSGKVEVHSEGLGRGSQFTVRIPLTSSLEAEASAVVTPTPKVSTGARLLVVDDCVDAAEMLARLLRISGHDVRTAYTGPTALETAITYLPDVILLDIGLPGLNGYEVARRIRANPDLKGIKLIAMTGYGNEEDVRRALEAGFDHHFVKPVAFPRLKEFLSRLVASNPDV